MYDTLIADLRKSADLMKEVRQSLYMDWDERQLRQAADAIEELQNNYDTVTSVQKYVIEKLKNDLDFAVRAEAAAVNARMPHWIPVTERLPEEWRIVLTFQPTSDDKGIIQTCVYIGIPGKWRQAWNHEFLELPVTHWMPLPEPPKEET